MDMSKTNKGYLKKLFADAQFADEDEKKRAITLLSRVINTPGLIRLKIEDIENALKDSRFIQVSIGKASGNGCVLSATVRAGAGVVWDVTQRAIIVFITSSDTKLEDIYKAGKSIELYAAKTCELTFSISVLDCKCIAEVILIRRIVL